MKALYNNPSSLIKVSQAGQSIVEVLVATAVVGVVITAIASGLTLSVKNTAEAKYKTLATTMAQQALEVYRRERVVQGWESFRDALGAGGTYCLNTLPTNSTAFVNLATGACTQDVVIAGTGFRRSAEVVPSNLDADPEPEQLQVTITMSWRDGARQRSVNIEQAFRQW